MAPTTFAHLSIASGDALDTVIIRVHGDFDVPAAASLQRVLDGLLEDADIAAIQVHLDRVRGVDVAGVSDLGAAAQRAERRGAVLTLVNPPELLCAALEAEGLTGLIRMVHLDRRPPWSMIDSRRRSPDHPSGQRPDFQGPDSGKAHGI
jgi:anti-anti-sigma factor